MNSLILDEKEALEQAPEWWTAMPTDEEIEEMARRYEEEAWGRLVVASDAEDHGWGE